MRPTTRLTTTHRTIHPNTVHRQRLRHRNFASSFGAVPDPLPTDVDTDAQSAPPLEGPSNSISKKNIADAEIAERMKELQERLIEAQRALQVKSCTPKNNHQCQHIPSFFPD